MTHHRGRPPIFSSTKLNLQLDCKQNSRAGPVLPLIVPLFAHTARRPTASRRLDDDQVAVGHRPCTGDWRGRVAVDCMGGRCARARRRVRRLARGAPASAPVRACLLCASSWSVQVLPFHCSRMQMLIALEVATEAGPLRSARPARSGCTQRRRRARSDRSAKRCRQQSLRHARRWESC